MIALRQMAEHVGLDVVEPRDSCGLLAPDGFRKRDDLLADENAEQSHQRDDRRRRRADIEQAIDDADEQPRAKRQKIEFQGKSSSSGGNRSDRDYRSGAIRLYLAAGFGPIRLPCLTRSAPPWTWVTA